MDSSAGRRCLDMGGGGGVFGWDEIVHLMVDLGLKVWWVFGFGFWRKGDERRR